MTLTPTEIDIASYPIELQCILTDAKIYDSSCSREAKVLFIDKDCGYYLKSAPKGALERQYSMTRYFNSKGLTSKVIAYISDEQDWLLTEKIQGDDCITAKYLEEPEKLCDLLAQRLALLHSESFEGCPIQNHTQRYLTQAKQNKRFERYDNSNCADNFGYKTPQEAWAVVEANGHLLQNKTLLHGDYCLPNIILDNWDFSGYIDLDNGGVGDPHVDVFWGIWSLSFNLNTDKYRRRFIDAYGRDKVDEHMLRVVAAVEVFG